MRHVRKQDLRLYFCLDAGLGTQCRTSRLVFSTWSNFLDYTATVGDSAQSRRRSTAKCVVMPIKQRTVILLPRKGASCVVHSSPAHSSSTAAINLPNIIQTFMHFSFFSLLFYIFQPPDKNFWSNYEMDTLKTIYRVLWRIVNRTSLYANNSLMIIDSCQSSNSVSIINQGNQGNRNTSSLFNESDQSGPELHIFNYNTGSLVAKQHILLFGFNFIFPETTKLFLKS